MNTIIKKVRVGSKTFNSIKNKLIIYITGVFILVIGIVLLANFYYSTFISEYDKLYKEYNALNKFFGNLNAATEHIKSYCYSHETQDYKKYLKSIITASDNLNYLKSAAGNIEGAQQTTELMEATTDLLRYNVDKNAKVSDFNGEIESIKNFIIISIEDNGPGIDSELIENILSREGQECELASGIGVINVKRRLEMFFGIKGLFDIQSSPGCGTVVTIKLPLKDNKEENSHV